MLHSLTRGYLCCKENGTTVIFLLNIRLLSFPLLLTVQKTLLLVPENFVRYHASKFIQCLPLGAR